MERLQPQQDSCSPHVLGFLQGQRPEGPSIQRAVERESCPDVGSRTGGFTQTPETAFPANTAHSQMATTAPPVPVKRVTTSVFAAPRLAPTYVDIPVPIYVPRYVEVPVPVAKLDAQITQQQLQQQQLLLRDSQQKQHEQRMKPL